MVGRRRRSRAKLGTGAGPSRCATGHRSWSERRDAAENWRLCLERLKVGEVGANNDQLPEAREEWKGSVDCLDGASSRRVAARVDDELLQSAFEGTRTGQ